MAQKLIGLDLGTHAVKIVLVSAGLRSIQVLDVREEPVEARPGGDDSIDAAVEVALAVLRKRGWHHYPVSIVLPGTQGSYRLLKFPFPDARRIGQAVGFEADGQFPFPLEQLEHDHIVLPPRGGEGRALVVASRQELVSRVAAIFREAHVDVKLVTVTPLALAQVMTGTPVLVPESSGDDEAGPKTTPIALVVDIGHRSTEMTALGPKGPYAARVLRRGGLHVTRAIAKLLDADLERAEDIKLRDAFLPHSGVEELRDEQLRMCKTVAQAVEPIVRELQHTRIWLRSEHGYEVTSIRLVGGGARLRGLDRYLSEQLELPVSEAEVQPVHGLRRAGGRDWTTAMAALGGAVGAVRRPHVQLYTSTSSGESTSGWLFEKMPAIAAMGLAILAFGALDTMARLNALNAQEEAYRQELGDATKGVFGESIYREKEIQTLLTDVAGEDLTSYVAKRGAVEVLAAIVKAATPEGPKPVIPDPNLPPGAIPDPATGGLSGPVGPGTVLGNPMDDVGPYVGEAGVTRTGPDGKPIDPRSVAAGLPPDADGSTDGSSETVISPTSGIAWDDELYFRSIDIRPLKMSMKVTATRNTAKDRLKVELEKITCINNVNNSKTQDENERKVWNVEIDHNCFNGKLEGST